MKKDKHDIAYDLEKIVCQKFNLLPQQHTGSIFSTDKIDSCGMFFYVMDLLLINFGKCHIDFSEKYSKYAGINMEAIPDYEKIFEEFKTYLD